MTWVTAYREFRHVPMPVWAAGVLTVCAHITAWCMENRRKRARIELRVLKVVVWVAERAALGATEGEAKNDQS